jgi:hypothetical protein
MRNIFLVAATLLASTAHANPTTQVCLGNIDDFLTCPAGAQRSGTECRAREPQRGQAAGEHWSGSKRQGPAVFMRDATKVSFAASYKDHKKTGRVFRFDDQGRLESWTDMANDEYNGLSVTCLPDGRAWYLAYYKDGRVVGISRSWRAKDGSFSYAMDHDAQGRSFKVTVPAAMQKRPDHLCQPQRCDVNAAPDLSGVPKP